MLLSNTILPDRCPSSRWNVEFESNVIRSIERQMGPASSVSLSSMVVPPLCHPHIHLDKPYLLTCNAKHHLGHDQTKTTEYPSYSDLTPQSGTFGEALSFTGQAKARYTPDDLNLRGSQLVATSLTQGVTSCRAFVELDHVTGTKCLDASVKLKEAFGEKFELQICAFAQDPIFSSEHGDENRRILKGALQQYGRSIAALGTTPYVESSRQASIANVAWAIDTALEHDLHLDFHLDYNLDDAGESEPLIWEVIRLLNEAGWTAKAKDAKTIVLGHCSSLTLLSNKQMRELASQIHESNLPIHFVGLPTSDLFMMGRPKNGHEDEGEATAHRPRGTLHIPSMIREFGLNACISVNNVGNAFTPWGTGDPLALASLGVGIYQAGTEDDARLLWESVSSRARKAIGIERSGSNTIDDHTSRDDEELLWTGREGELLLVKNEEWVGCPGFLGSKVPARQRVSIKDIVWDPPEARLRKVIRSEG